MVAMDYLQKKIDYLCKRFLLSKWIWSLKVQCKDVNYYLTGFFLDFEITS